MDIAEKIRILAIKNKITVQQLAEKSGQSSANLYNKLSRNTFKLSELEKIATSIGAELEVNFIMPDGTKI
jgi:transcriptional regulator with XRE-family HTH domain